MLKKSMSFFLFTPLSALASDLNIYTYGSFTSEWGPGPAIEEAYESHCGCEIEWTAVDDAAVLLSRLRLEGSASSADIVLGLDTNLMAEAYAEGLVRDHELDDISLSIPIDWSDPAFIPFDYGYFAVVHDSERMPDPPESLAELISDGSTTDLIIQDRRTSTPGLGLMLWLGSVYGEQAPEIYRQLSSRVLTVTKGWSEAYGLFLDGEATMVLSYTTSPAYHELVEEETRYRALIFPEGHYMQIEVAAIGAYTKQFSRARDFMQFITSADFQKTIPTGNWMYPVIDLGEDLPEVFRKLPIPEVSLLLPSETVRTKRREWINEWLTGFTSP